MVTLRNSAKRDILKGEVCSIGLQTLYGVYGRAVPYGEGQRGVVAIALEHLAPNKRGRFALLYGIP